MRKHENIYKGQDERAFFRMLVSLFMSQRGREFDSIEAMRFAKTMWGIDEDWHLFSDVLDSLHMNGKARIVRTGADGHHVYRIEG